MRTLVARGRPQHSCVPFFNHLLRRVDDWILSGLDCLGRRFWIAGRYESSAVNILRYCSPIFNLWVTFVVPSSRFIISFGVYPNLFRTAQVWLIEQRPISSSILVEKCIQLIDHAGDRLVDEAVDSCRVMCTSFDLVSDELDIRS